MRLATRAEVEDRYATGCFGSVYQIIKMARQSVLTVGVI
jgi:hypothetical protein